MKLKEAILLLLGANNAEPINSILHLKSMLFLVDACINIEGYNAKKEWTAEVEAVRCARMLKCIEEELIP